MKPTSFSLILCLAGTSLLLNAQSPVSSASASHGRDIDIQKIIGLGYFSDPAENLFELFHLASVPDSIYGYEMGSEEGPIITEKLYYTFDGNILYALNSSEIYLSTEDILYYNEKGCLDSAILESEADPEYSDYAIKHIYTYEDDRIVRERIDVDHQDDSINDDWEHARIIDYSYDKKDRMVEILERIPHEDSLLNYSRTAIYYDHSDPNEVLRIDTFFVEGDGGKWFPCEIFQKRFTPEMKCKTSIRLRYNSCYSDDPGNLPENLEKKVMIYNELGQLEEENLLHYNNGWEYYRRNSFEYVADGTRTTKKIYQFWQGVWYHTYRYDFYPQSGGTQINENDIRENLIYPNPATDLIHIEGLMEDSRVSIYSTDGKLCSEGRSAQGDVSISDLIPGVYIVRIPVAESVHRSLLLIKK